MKKEFLKLVKVFQNRKKNIEAQFSNALTPEQKQALLAGENSAIDDLITAIEAMPDNPEIPEITEIKKMVTDMQTALEENQTDFENKLKEMFETKTEKQFINFIQKAVEDKIFENSSNSNKEIGRTFFKNASGINVVYNDGEVGVEMSQVPTLLDYIRQIRLNGETTVMWNEVDGTTDASAVVAVGGDKPIRTNAHTFSSVTTQTIAVISKLPIQYAKAISILADIYLNEMGKDIYRKLNAVLLSVLAAGSDLVDVAGAVPTIDAPQLIDAIRIVASSIKNLYPENRVVIGLSQKALFELDSVKDTNGNYILYDFASKGIDIVSVPVVAPFTDTKILGMSENVVRWYNDGIVNKTSDHAYWANNQIGLMMEVLSSTMVLRATDAKATIFDDYKTIITDLTA